MRYKNKTTSIRVVLRLIVGLTTILFVLTLTNALNAEDVTSHKGRFWNWNVKPVEECGKELKYGHFELIGDLTCPNPDDPYDPKNPAITIIGPAKLNLNGHTLAGNGDNVCIQINGEGAKVWNGTVTNCKNGILIEESHRNMIIDVEASNNDKRGFIIDKGHENMLFDCIAKDNDKQGFLIEGEGGDRNKLVKCLAEDNSNEGFSIEGGNGNKMFKCLAKNNDKKGFSIKNGDDNLQVMCNAETNGQQGFNIEDGARNKIYYSKAIANCKDGIEIAKAGNDNWVIYNHVEDNGNEESCLASGEEYKPQSYAGIDIEDGSQNNKIKYNRAGCNLGCVGDDDFPCKARYRDFWDENVDENGNCDSTNKWENNSIACKNTVPETLCADEGDD